MIDDNSKAPSDADEREFQHAWAMDELRARMDAFEATLCEFFERFADELKHLD